MAVFMSTFLYITYIDHVILALVNQKSCCLTLEGISCNAYVPQPIQQYCHDNKYCATKRDVSDR